MKGQVSMEVIIGAIILLVTLVLVIFYANGINLNVDAMKGFTELKADCTGIADIISSVYSSGKKTTTEFYSEKDFNVSNGIIEVEGYSCRHYGKAQNVFITKGNVRIKDLNGVVVIENM